MPLSDIRLDARQYVIIDQIRRLNSRMALQERETFDDLVSNTLRLGHPSAEIFGYGDMVVEGDGSIESSLNVGTPTTRAATATGDASIAGNLLVEGSTTLQGLTIDSLEVGNPVAVAGLGDVAIQNDLDVEGTTRLGVSFADELEIGNPTATAAAGDLVVENDLDVEGTTNLGALNAGVTDLGNTTVDRLEVGSATGTPGAGDLYVADELSVDGIANLGTINGSSIDVGSGNVRGGDAQFTGDVTTDGGMYAGDRTANPPAGEIAADNDIIAGGGMAVGNVSAGPATGDILFYNGGTNVGQLGSDDTTWFRINQDISKNIYTPRYFRAEGGLSAGNVAPSTGVVHAQYDLEADRDVLADQGIRAGSMVNSNPASGDINYKTNLRPERGSTLYTGYVYYPIARQTVFDGAAKSDSTGSFNVTSYGCPTGTKAIAVRLICRDSAGLHTAVPYWSVGPTSTDRYQLACYGVGGDLLNSVGGICNVTSLIAYWRAEASGSSTLDVWLYIYGYFV
jgi:hypothetical protein